jgi:hypothetical protein
MRALALLMLVGAVSLAAAPQQAPKAKVVPKVAPAPRAAAPRVEPRREAVVPFSVGETLVYDVSWSRLMTAGTATTRVIEKRASFGSTAYAVVAEGRPLPLIQRLYPLYYKMDSLVDSFSLLSQWSALYTEEGARKRLASTIFDRRTRKANYEINNEPTSKMAIPIQGETQDGLTLLYALRARNFAAGDRFTVPVADDGTLYTVELSTSGPERLRLPLGERETWNVNVRIVDADKRPVGDNIEIWFTTDPKHIPAKIQADLPVGSFVLALKDVH